MLHFNDDTLNEYLDDALTPIRRAEVEDHLATCAECQTRLAGWRVVFVTLEALPEAPLERDLSRQVLAALRPQPAPLPLIVRWAFVAQATLAFGLTLAAAFIFSFTIAPANSFLNPVFDSLARSTESVAAQWQATWGAAQNALTREFEAALALLPHAFDWPWLAGLGAVLLLWLVGNGVILRGVILRRFLLAPQPQRSQNP